MAKFVFWFEVLFFLSAIVTALGLKLAFGLDAFQTIVCFFLTMILYKIGD